MTAPDLPFRFRSIALPAILPTLAFSIGEGAVFPIIPIVADRLGADLAMAGLVAAMIMIGRLIGDIPSGWVIARIGERSGMIYASALSIAGLVLAMLAPGVLLLAIGVLLIGLASAVFALARHAFMTTFVPIAYRARALSTLGGTFRFGYFVGPLLAAGVIQLTGSAQSVFWVHVVGCLVAAALLLFMPDPTATFRRNSTASGRTEGEDFVAREAQGLFHTMWENRGVLVKLGGGATLIGAVRASRLVIVPLWAVSIGISPADTALIIGIAGSLDFALFYVSGQVMDRFGRLASALPSMIGLGIGHFALAFSHDVDGRQAWFIGITMFLALANGLGSGLLMTLGSDLAGEENPAPFLGAWRFTEDGGAAVSPLAIAAVTAASALWVAAATMGVVALVGAGILLRYVPRYIPRVRR